MANQKIALVIDDEPDVVELIKDCLKEKLHYLVLSATDPEVAVDLAQSYLFDLLILDLHMPKLDGFQVLEMVRKKQPDVKVMVITGLYERYKERFKQVRVDKIIEKPFEFPKFEEEVVSLAGAVDRKTLEGDAGFIPKAKILLVDDEREQCEALQEFILEDKPNCYEVEIAEDAEEGIQKTNEFEPDIILFDIKMPHLRGDEMMERIKKGDGHKPKLFIAISAIGLQDTIHAVEAAGSLYITKPFRIEEVLRVIRKNCRELKLRKNG
ncbi:MAG: hypothetical protein A3C35_02865 [Omnitrophica bacterium RIFCSPHIGHO2_02_FULL_46_11]|nr:MAG: hypothetical protein A3C35_02865 [Omnitrophica bacterium RIFCSPHIGHO2_02_FULL_46_11]OGW84862.1 MAG: hypothetical protein A3A81_00895 [Omnitrophica bacterium RIFCSPLOWO2_01_FULL_45_10b]